jgi:hypothetical protein
MFVSIETSRITHNAGGFLSSTSSAPSTSSSEDDEVSAKYSESDDSKFTTFTGEQYALP